MSFPRTQVGGRSLSRMIIGSNWFLGWSHTSMARDQWLKASMGRRQIADVLEVFFRAGVDTVMGIRADAPHFNEAIKDAEDRVGCKAVRITTPTLVTADTPQAHDENSRILDAVLAIGADMCLPHQCTTDAMVDKNNRSIPGMDRLCAMIRQRGMGTGLSTHMPESPIYADESGLDVDTYIQLYNAAGFLMQVEIDWVQRMIWQRAKPVMTIKPLAAGKLPPLVGLAFAWATIRPVDMVTVGTFLPDEAREVIEISLACLEGRCPGLELQRTRSKQSILSK